MRQKMLSAAVLAALLVGSGTDFTPARPSAAQERPRADAAPLPGSPLADDSQGGPVELDWDALIPAQWRPDKLMEQYNAEELADDDPRAIELLEKLKSLWSEAPVVKHLDGRNVKLPGFVVPLETDGNVVSEFLLVPYYGACIHVPPPPANQTVYIVTAKGDEYRGRLFDAVWVTGRLQVTSTRSDLADAGYKIRARAIEPYE